jgi:hypothetical protein
VKKLPSFELLRLARFIRHGDLCVDAPPDVREKGELARKIFAAYEDDIRAQAADGDGCARRLVEEVDGIEREEQWT